MHEHTPAGRTSTDERLYSDVFGTMDINIATPLPKPSPRASPVALTHRKSLPHRRTWLM